MELSVVWLFNDVESIAEIKKLKMRELGLRWATKVRIRLRRRAERTLRCEIAQTKISNAMNTLQMMFF
jgi:hypothetical protein